MMLGVISLSLTAAIVALLIVAGFRWKVARPQIGPIVVDLPEILFMGVVARRCLQMFVLVLFFVRGQMSPQLFVRETASI